MVFTVAKINSLKINMWATPLPYAVLVMMLCTLYVLYSIFLCPPPLIHLLYQVNNLMVVSAPQENTQGWLGWNTQSKTPRSRDIVWPFRILTGTIKGFFSKSLKKIQKIKFLSTNLKGPSRGKTIIVLWFK